MFHFRILDYLGSFISINESDKLYYKPLPTYLPTYRTYLTKHQLICNSVVNPDTDPHQIERWDPEPDPYRSDKLDPDQSDKQDPDPEPH